MDASGVALPLVPFDVPGDASGHYDMTEVLVYGFSHNTPVQRDPQLYQLLPDIATRGWMAGWMDNEQPSEFTVDFLEACHANNIRFMGGITGSAVFRADASSDTEFLDWITRDATGNPLEHAQSYPGLYRGSLANPKYRAHLLDKIKLQIDLGVDGITVDEADGTYSGGTKWIWNGNEGYDDYFIADFNRYLMEKYPSFQPQDWIRTYGMTEDNVIRRDIPADDLEHNFNYRRYLATKGWSTNPLSSKNPLAKEWGPHTNGRLRIDDPSFMYKAIRLYWKDLVLSARSYARQKYGKEILFTANGLFPYVDYNSLGMYNYNTDDDGREADYVPVTSDGHLNGTKSLKPIFKKVLARHRQVAGEVPLLVFIDWPGGMIDAYYALPTSEKKDLWQIYVPEAYALGLRYAFHLKTCLSSDPTATASGVLDFMASYSAFYKNNRDLYSQVSESTITADVGVANVEATSMDQPSRSRTLLHLVNHNYDKGILPQSNVKVSISSTNDPVSITCISPDVSAPSSVAFTRVGGRIEMVLDSLTYYDVLAIAW
jgi:hypothetical protein